MIFTAGDTETSAMTDINGGLIMVKGDGTCGFGAILYLDEGMLDLGVDNNLEANAVITVSKNLRGVVVG